MVKIINAIRSIKRAGLILISAGVVLLSSATQAQTQTPSSEELAALVSVINLLLLDGPEKPIPQPTGTGVLLNINQLSPVTYTVTDNLYAEFAQQTQAVELCFIIESATAVPSGSLVVEVNGVPFNAQLGENCFAMPVYLQRSVNYINLIINGGGITVSLTTLELAATAQTQLTLPRLTRGAWDERAVRKVIKIFAFGGHATDTQIIEWAAMHPQDAIQEMLNFSEHNLKLSPLAVGETYTESTTIGGTLFDFLTFLSDDASNLPIPAGNRSQYAVNGYNFDDGFNRMITTRGLNPFRQRIGFWETNYHLATNLDAGVSRERMAAYYDEIMQAHAAGSPYHQVMGVAAKSAAVAYQYGHRRNEWRYDYSLGEYYCKCNDDFAREIHQLFYGIFGVDDPNHEDGTINETAKMLTDMPVEGLSVNFGTAKHHTADLIILGQTISGGNASAKIDNLMPISMQHPESLKNLPVMIISTLADDNLSEATSNQLRAAWASMGIDKYLLNFIQAYAVSTLFHNPGQFKYLTSHERALYMANKNNLDNLEAFYGGGGGAGRSVGGQITDDQAGDFFKPLHNVFGGQTSFEAADSALVFENNYNELTDHEDRMRSRVGCSTCDAGQPWVKKWNTVLPQRADGQFYVADVAAWLWKHAVGNFDNYTELEKAHLYSFLGAARSAPGETYDGSEPFDFNLLMCVVQDYQAKESASDAPVASLLLNSTWDDYCRHGDDGVSGYSAAEQAAINRVYTEQEVANDPLLQNVLSQLANFTLPLNATTGSNGGADVRKYARERVSFALGFIFTTPFIFAEGQQ